MALADPLPWPPCRETPRWGSPRTCRSWAPPPWAAWPHCCAATSPPTWSAALHVSGAGRGGGRLGPTEARPGWDKASALCGSRLGFVPVCLEGARTPVQPPPGTGALGEPSYQRGFPWKELLHPALNWNLCSGGCKIDTVLWATQTRPTRLSAPSPHSFGSSSSSSLNTQPSWQSKKGPGVSTGLRVCFPQPPPGTPRPDLLKPGLVRQRRLRPGSSARHRRGSHTAFVSPHPLSGQEDALALHKTSGPRPPRSPAPAPPRPGPNHLRSNKNSGRCPTASPPCASLKISTDPGRQAGRAAPRAALSHTEFPAAFRKGALAYGATPGESAGRPGLLH